MNLPVIWCCRDNSSVTQSRQEALDWENSGFTVDVYTSYEEKESVRLATLRQHLNEAHEVCTAQAARLSNMTQAQFRQEAFEKVKPMLVKNLLGQKLTETEESQLFEFSKQARLEGFKVSMGFELTPI